MKTNLREMVLGVGLFSLAFCAGCETHRANAESAQTQPSQSVQAFTNTPPSPPEPGTVAGSEDKPLRPFPPASAGATVTAPTAPTNPTAAAVAAAPVNAIPPGVAPSTNAPIVQPATVPEQLNLSPALTQVVKLIQGGVSQDVVMAYVTNSTDLFNVGSNEILYLHDLGAPAPVITALIRKDSTPEADRKSVV